MNRAGTGFRLVLGVLFSAVFMWSFYNAVTAAHPTAVQPDVLRSFFWMLATAAVCFALGLALQLLGRRSRGPTAFLRRHERLCLLLFWLVVVPLQAAFLFSAFQLTGWDVKMLYDSAWAAVHEPLEKIDWSYYYVYPNNTFLLACETAVVRFCAASLPGLSRSMVYGLMLSANLLAADFALGCLYALARRVWGRRWAWLCLLYGTLLLGFNPWMTVLYSDTLALLFPTFFLWLLVGGENARHWWSKALFYLLAGAVLAAGVSVKPTVIIAGIAALLARLYFAVFAREKKLKKLAAVLCAALILAAGAGASRTAIKHYVARTLGPSGWNVQGDSDMEFPWAHFLLMGAVKYEVAPGITYYGAWNNKIITYTSSFTGYQNKVDADLRAYRALVAQQGAAAYLRYLAEKLGWIMGDGSFFWGREGIFYQGVDPETVALQGAWGRSLKPLLQLGSPGNRSLEEFQQGIWLYCLLLLSLSFLVVGRERSAVDAMTVRLALIGILAFILLFEGRSRYLFLYLPFFLLAAAGVQQRLLELLCPKPPAKRPNVFVK